MSKSQTKIIYITDQIQTDAALTNCQELSIRHLSNPKVAKVVRDALLYFAVLFVLDTKDLKNKDSVKMYDCNDIQSNDIIPRYVLFRWVLMPNHVHILIQPLLNPKTGKYFPLENILHSIKSYTGSEANNILSRKGRFWQHESYDHIVRGEKEFYRIWKYISYNPVKARLCVSEEEWEWSSAYFNSRL